MQCAQNIADLGAAGDDPRFVKRWFDHIGHGEHLHHSLTHLRVIAQLLAQIGVKGKQNVVLLCQLDCAEAALPHAVVQLKQHARQMQDRRAGKGRLRQLFGTQLTADGAVAIICIIPAGGEVFEKCKSQLAGIGMDDCVRPDTP